MKNHSRKCCSGLESLLTPGMFKALSDPHRIAILIRLAESCASSNVSQVAECCSVDLSVVSRHLAILRKAGIVESTRCGKEVFYSVCYLGMVVALRKIADALESCCSGGAKSDESPS
jgi:DNA-binding transcriptional ArsR family regulator